jgi:hypothetical protein
MDIKKSFGTNKEAEQQGVWVDLDETTKLKIARGGNKANRELVKKLLAPHKIALRNDKLPEHIIEDVGCKAMAQTILLDWQGMQEDGKNLPYTPENAERLLKDYPDFRDQVAQLSGEISLFQIEQEEAKTKN